MVDVLAYAACEMYEVLLDDVEVIFGGESHEKYHWV
ncbi:hypothetical protein L905_07220 [Agrobacterium sp. TS43]|nr:hypothetical protein L902_02065 [Agrobacterium radiobacter DSM 30147]KVK49939.1 hypothetical protein L903_18875 [Agrobacterium sp. JL28]KVK50231.1 hypothetical protein L904_18875 [Agrobacterium sp. LY4]KVK59273.1 hypothetical protein L905_07220 [Agrobacterium sp. TS43]KVK62987.1 hypothetical protein L906_18005 [Agrobacterium sp. TS45]KVK67511.1 hypothetical protein L907_17975 [Agrobacterium sp. C13]